jgi:hypothetical protein
LKERWVHASFKTCSRQSTIYQLMDAVVRNITIASINKKERRKEKTTS